MFIWFQDYVSKYCIKYGIFWVILLWVNFCMQVYIVGCFGDKI